MLSKEAIYRLTAFAVVVMLRFDLDVIYIVELAIEGVNTSYDDILLARRIPTLIPRARNHNHRSRRGQRRNLDVVCIDAKIRCILARRASLHDGGYHVHRRRDLDAIVNGSQQKCLRASSGPSGHRKPIRVYIRKRLKKIRYAGAVPYLQAQRPEPP